MVNGSSGSLRSVTLPSGRYPPDLDCEWRLLVPEGSAVSLTFSQFQLEDDSDCSYDFLEVRLF